MVKLTIKDRMSLIFLISFFLQGLVMIFYDGGGAPNARRVRIYLSEKGLDIPMKTIDIMKGEHKTDEYKKNKSPFPSTSLRIR